MTNLHMTIESYIFPMNTTFKVGIPSDFVIQESSDILLTLSRIKTVTEYASGFVRDLRIRVGGFDARFSDASELNDAFYVHHVVNIDGPIIITGRYSGAIGQQLYGCQKEDDNTLKFGLAVYASRTLEQVD